MNWGLFVNNLKETIPFLEDGFEYRLTDWEPLGDDYMKCLCIVYFQGAEICSVPGILTKQEWNNGNPDTKIIASLIKNILQVSNDCALSKLGWPPYDKKVKK